MKQRPLAIVLALLLAAAACKGDGDSKAADNEPAGEVIELTGAVTAERAGTKRPLALGDKLHGVDVVSTAPDASLAVRLFHNGAVWRIEGGKRRQLSKTAAWRAAKTSGQGLARAAGRDETAAAGRHGERSAVDTRATARDEKKQRPRKGGIPPRQEPGEALTGKSTPRPGGLLGETRRPTPPPRATLDVAPTNSDPLGDGETPDRIGGKDGEVGSIGRGPVATTGGKGAAPAPKSLVAFKLPTVRGDLPVKLAMRALRRHHRGLRSCHEKALTRDSGIKGDLTLTFMVDAEGKVVKVTIDGAITDKAMRACVTAKARSVQFPRSNQAGLSVVVQRVKFGLRK